MQKARSVDRFGGYRMGVKKETGYVILPPSNKK
jgi:hypothetical protein